MSNYTFDALVDAVTSNLLLASETHNTKKAYLAYSGGGDSALMVEAVRRSPLISDPEWQFRVMSIRTGLEDKGHVARVNADLSRVDMDVHWYEGAGLSWYIDNVMSYGFGYSPSHHTVYYQYLKRDAIEKSLKDFKDKYHERILTVTGVRRAESYRRYKTPLMYHRRGARVTVNAIAHVSNEEREALLPEVAWWQGKTTIDCNCNWHRYSDITTLNDEARKHIEEMNGTMRELGLWGYGEAPSPEQLAMFGDTHVYEAMPEDSLCISCLTNR